MSLRSRSALRGAVQSALFLVGGLVLSLVIGNLIFAGLAGRASDPIRVVVSLIPTIAALAAGGALWGVSMGRLAGTSALRRMAWAGVLGFVPTLIGFGIVLIFLESVALTRWGAWIPIHRLFTLLFVPSAFLIIAMMTLVIGKALHNPAVGWGLAVRAGLSGAAAFLAVNWIMEAIGWKVGGPGAAERYTMLTVTFMADLGAALAGGAVLGAGLDAAREAQPPTSRGAHDRWQRPEPQPDQGSGGSERGSFMPRTEADPHDAAVLRGTE